MKEQSAKNTTGAVGLAYHMWIPFSICRVQSVQLKKVKERIKDQSALYNFYITTLIMHFPVQKSDKSIIRLQVYQRLVQNQIYSYLHNYF